MLDYLGGLNASTRVLIRGRQVRVREDVMTEGEVREGERERISRWVTQATSFEVRRRGHKECRRLLEIGKKQRKIILS